MQQFETRRACDGCGACCYVLDVHVGGILKSAFSLCGHSNESGCAVHENGLPRACDEWRCAWLQGWGDQLDWPKLTDVVPWWAATIQGKTLVLRGQTEEALKSTRIREQIRAHANLDTPVLLQYPSGKREIVFRLGRYVSRALQQKAASEGVKIFYVTDE